LIDIVWIVSRYQGITALKKNLFLIQVIVTLSLIFIFTQITWAVDTSLLFVGEDLSVLTIASRRAESSEQAPAVAQVITQKDLERYGVRTLGEALSMLPGFYISPKEWGSQPYLRGVKNGILFLYNSVPLTSDSTKSIHPLDEELSLDSIERIEIIRGPGSVLWGPDAFAGIVNIVPKRGRDLEGLEIKTREGTPDHETSTSMSWGHNAGPWEGFLSVSANRISPLEDRYNTFRLKDNSTGSSEIDRSRYLEAILNFSWQDWLHISGRWSNSRRPYVLKDPETDLTGKGRRESPFRFVRLELEKPIGRSRLRFNAYYNELIYKENEVDLSWDQRSHISYGEILYDRELWDAKGLFTLGGSYRYDKVTGAVIEQSYAPDFLRPESQQYNFIPSVRQRDFNTSLWSFFSQVRHHWNHLDAWLGLRLDNHSQYSPTVSHNMGIGWSPWPLWHLKLLYGTAYRTPYNQELVGRKHLDPEKVRNLSAYITWRPFTPVRLSVTPFWNRIRHHIQEDPSYKVLSSPGSEDIYGIELEAKWQAASNLKFWANATFLSQEGDDEGYDLDVKIINPDGTMESRVYSSWKVPFDTGPKNLLNAGILWSPLDRLDFSLRLGYANSRKVRYKQDRIRYSTRPSWIVDTTITAHDVLFRGLDAQLALKNIFDKHHMVPGTYSPIKASPFETYLGLTWHY